MKHDQLRRIEQTDIDRMRPQSFADYNTCISLFVAVAGIFREQPYLRADDASQYREPHNAPVKVTGKNQIRSPFFVDRDKFRVLSLIHI